MGQTNSYNDKFYFMTFLIFQVINSSTYKGSPVLTYAFMVSSEIGAMKTLVLSVNLTILVHVWRTTPVKTVCVCPPSLLKS
jgi:hypothetical protein